MKKINSPSNAQCNWDDCLWGSSVKNDHRETADHYRGEVWRFGIYRISTCRDDIQWLFQRKRPGFLGGGAAWDTLGYCTTRNGLVRLHRAHIGGEAAEIADFSEKYKRQGDK